MANDSGAVLIADDHPLCRAGLTTIFRRDLGVPELWEAQDFSTVLAKITAHPSIGLVTIDLDLPGLRAGAGLRDLRMRFPAVRLVVVAADRDRERVLDSLCAGVHGYIPKDLPVDEMLAALQMVVAGQIFVPALVSDLAARKEHGHGDDVAMHDGPLTDRQFEVLNLLAAGRSNKEIARTLHIAEGTVKVHIAAAFRMLGVHNRVSAAAAMRARASNDGAIDTYLPGLFDEQIKRPILERAQNNVAHISFRR
ncbi:LuxR C-terminal-related transcriptional regulator [Sphingopyxis macrogoltabida]|uniref:LuxR C-terminal-related transcriptional regulator n=1 Tax=Sphingopyxis macrogoltabida TaxID=33050 RepID=UPI000A5DBA50|nr:response regulator transcription factor [Sphingopyxis macrogoltabida]